LEIGDVEDAVGILVGINALGRQRLDVVEDAILERDGVVEGDELVVVVVDDTGVRKINGKDTDALGSYVGPSACGCDATAMGGRACVTYTCWSAHWTGTQGP